MNEKKKLWSLLGVIGALCSIGGFFLVLAQILGKSLVKTLLIPVAVPLSIIVVGAIFALILLMIMVKYIIKQDYPSSVFHEQPRQITSKRTQSATPVTSEILRSPAGAGAIATWVYLHPFGQGIRRLVNNRYIVAHDTNGGVTKKIAGQNRWVNVFALSNGPTSYSPPNNPLWKLVLSNGNGESNTWSFEDSEELKPGWRHFLIRWDHARPLLELLIDKRPVIRASDYQSYWPQEYSNKILIGAWTNRATKHFIETWVWRTFLFSGFIGDAWLRGELARIPPELQ